MVTLVLGGNRSGKSQFAESLLAGADGVEYLATAAAAPDDPEWAARVRVHRERRPAHWRTVESGDVAGRLAVAGDSLLIDSITAWLARAMDECGCWTATEPAGELAARADALVTAFAAPARETVAVSDEVGLGVVPETVSGRRFRDAGRLNQRLAAAADAVYLVVAGVALRLR